VTPPRVLIIAGSDSGGGAGIQADIKTVTMLGGHAMTAITAITAQNTVGVQAVMAVPAEMVAAQIDAVVRDIGVDAVKIGMIGSAETAHAVADRLEQLAVPIVFDPVMVATSGAVLADEATIAAFHRLSAIATITTPNRAELDVLLGEVVHGEGDQYELVETYMVRIGCRALLAKGGHWDSFMSGDDGRGGRFEEQLIDVLYISNPPQYLQLPISHERIETRQTHGTGCTLASAIAVELTRESDLQQACRSATDYLLAALRAAPGLGAGHGPIGHALGVVPFELIHKKQQ
jgi:hydroxymethylpyrimidine/phosphomethylpyrimidine kinase